jgi:L-threonylcarbamoyladenylate synthase
MEIIKIAEAVKNPKKVKEKLAEGGLIIYPTETCYGAGVDATNKKAVSKLLQYKNRPGGIPISVAVANSEKLFTLIEKNRQSSNIAEKFLPGPITLVGNSLGAVDRRIESEVGTLGVRMPAYPQLLELLEQIDTPLTATSANVSGDKLPYSIDGLFKSVSQSKQSLLDLVIDAGELEANPSSLVIDSSRANKVFREGILIAEDIKHGQVFISDSADETKRIAERFCRESLKQVDKLVFLLSGELGAGKTQFSAGIAKGLGITSVIDSPTFNIAKEYQQDSGTFYHLDLWRLTEKTSFEELDIDLHRNSNSAEKKVVCVEWPEMLHEDALADKTYCDVKIFKLAENKRRLVITEKKQ